MFDCKLLKIKKINLTFSQCRQAGLSALEFVAMAIRPSTLRLTAFLVGLLLLPGCTGKTIVRKDGQASNRAFELKNLAKSDIDLVCELTQRDVLAGLRRLAVKLYRRNPQEYRKAGFTDVDSAVARLFDPLPKWRESGMDRVDWLESMRLAFSEHYAGDRVYSFVLSLTVMVMVSYENRLEFYITDDLSAQSLYNSARNLESAAWRLAKARNAAGQPYLLSNALDETLPNLSFEREFGKLIAQQDLLAVIVEDRNNRTINRVIQNMASFVFLPV